MQDISFVQWATVEEIKLRGRVITMSCDLELLLLKIALVCLVSGKDEDVRNFKNLTMESKIAMINRELKKHFPEEYATNLKTIKYLDNIVAFRNKIAHCKIEWSNRKDKTYFNLLIISIIAEVQKPTLVKMTFTEFNERSEKMRQAILQILALLQKLEDKSKSIINQIQ